MDKEIFVKALLAILDGTANGHTPGEAIKQESAIFKEFKLSCKRRNLSASNFPTHNFLGPDVYSFEERIAKLAEDLLEIAALESGNAKMDVEQVNVKGAILDVMEELHELSGKKKLHLVTHLDSQPLKIHADGRLVRRAVRQLLFNAVEYVPSGGTVEVLAKGLPQEVMISVMDNGNGLAPENKDKTFERFCEGENCCSKQSGIGIGLNLVKNIVEAHGGRVWAESRQSEGFKVSFCVPREQMCEIADTPRTIKPLFS